MIAKSVGEGTESETGVIRYKLFIYRMAKHQGLIENRIQYPMLVLPWELSGKESTYQHRSHGLHPWSGKIPHALEQLRPCAITIEPVLQSLATTTNESMCHNYKACMF